MNASSDSFSGTGAPPTTVLFTCVGRRVELMQAFRAAAARLGLTLKVAAVDADPTAPALAYADVKRLLPRATDPDYIPALAAFARQTQARLLIPTTDTDLLALSAARADFERDGCLPLIGAPEVVRVCRDKLLTFDLLRAAGIDTPATYTPAQIRAEAQPRFPLFIKPRTGSASIWVHKINDAEELAFYLQRVNDPIVQEFVVGIEHTLDVYVGLSGAPRCVVPRARWQVRAGEVSKGVVVKHHGVMAAGRRVVEKLGDSLRGLVTLQCILTPDDRIRFIEINPRFGGGAPLSIAAGADFPRWLLEELHGRAPAIALDGFRHGIAMLRYDWSVFVGLDEDLRAELRPPLNPSPPFIDPQ